MAKLTPAPTPADGDQTAAKSQSQRFYAISADVTKPEENARVLAVVTEWNNGQPPDIVWANAGSAHPTLFVDTSLETMKSQMDINYWAASYLAHATLKVWLKPAAKAATDEVIMKWRGFALLSYAEAVFVAGLSQILRVAWARYEAAQ